MASDLDLERIIKDPFLRINNLYYIIDKQGQKIKFTLNWAQQLIYRDMHYCNVILKARQLGVSTLVSMIFLDRCLFNSNLSAGLIAHTRDDAEVLFRKITFAYESLPNEIKDLRKATTDSARELKFSNGSSIRTGTSMRGSTLNYLLVSEMGKICASYPEKAREVISGSLNTVAPGNFIFIESTAEGRSGYFYELCQRAKELSDAKKPLGRLDYRFFFLPWHRCSDYVLPPSSTPISAEQNAYFESIKVNHKIELSPEQKSWYISKLSLLKSDTKREFPSTSQEAWETSAQGSFYSDQLARCRLENRIGHVPYDSELPTHSAWDLGYSDSTAIWLFQISGRELHFIDFIQGNLQPMTYYLKLLKEKPYSYATHLVPFDAKNREYSLGFSRAEVAAKNGFRFTIVPREIGVTEGIDAVRGMLNRCWFDAEKCSQGIQALEEYKREWLDGQGCWGSRPTHDGNSHAADAFRILATGLNLIVGENEVMTDARAERLRSKALGYGDPLGLDESNPLYTGTQQYY